MCVKTAAAIHYAHCGINDVIAHSLKLHPELLADCIRSHAGVHAEFADAYNDREVMRNELDLADRLHSFAAAIDLGDYTIPDDVDVRRGAFSCAAGLQNLHPIMQKVIAAREDARNSRLARSG
jgi:chloramphenicol 3-O-phosphotransferase